MSGDYMPKACDKTNELLLYTYDKGIPEEERKQNRPTTMRAECTKCGYFIEVRDVDFKKDQPKSGMALFKLMIRHLNLLWKRNVYDSDSGCGRKQVEQ